MNVAVAQPKPAGAIARRIRVMIVDDAVVVRGLFTRWVEAEPDLEVVASLRTGRDAVSQIERVDPDVVVLDVEMPELDGVSALPLLLEKKRDLVVIMASTLTRRNAEISLKALSLGAADYIPKPSSNQEVTASATFRRDLIEKIRQLGLRSKRLRLAGARARQLPRTPLLQPRHPQPALVLRPMPATPPRVLLIGASTGGPQALNTIAARLDGVLDRAPVLITQHMPPTFTAILAEHLAQVVKRPVREAQDGEEVNAGTIYIAPGGQHMTVARRDGVAVIVARQRSADQLLQARGRSAVCHRRIGVGAQSSGAGAYRHGLGRVARRASHRRRRRPCAGAGRSNKRRLGHARPGGQCRPLLGGAAAQRDRPQAHPPVRGGAHVTPQDFDYLRKLLKERSGLVLSAEKQYLAESRLLPVARRHALATLGDLVGKLKGASAGQLSVDVVEAMTTNESFFFRDKIPFEHFRDTIVPALMVARAREKRIRIWCAACAAGQEPYSLAMSLKGLGAKLAGWRVDILATDISAEVLEKAKAGIYSQFEVQRGLPIQLLVKFFSQVGDTWQMAPEIRGMVQFRPLNLLNDFSPLGLFDLVFCRNVLIYFDQPTKIDVLGRLARQMPNDGFLVLGAAETVLGLSEAFKPVAEKRGLYMREPAAEPATNVVKFAAKA